MTLKLYGTHTSPYVRHCRIALFETGTEHELVQTDYEQSASMTPTRRVPFMHDGEVELRDSLSILRYIRERSGQPFFPELEELDRFALVNTALDTAINLFILEKDGLTPEHSPYLRRQAGRVADLLQLFERQVAEAPSNTDSPNDWELRLGCFLGWGLFRERISLGRHPHLREFLDRLETYPPFAETRPHLG